MVRWFDGIDLLKLYLRERESKQGVQIFFYVTSEKVDNRF
jgi:hypothetical protein